jgi:hypothetical protein
VPSSAGSWPGAEADDWWDSLPVERKLQIHRWITERGHRPPPPEDPPADPQLTLDVG